MTNPASVFSDDYAEARQRFRKSAMQLGWHLEAHPIAATGPSGEALNIDVGMSPGGDPERVLVVSSGVHGVEGFFGSAVQIALLEQWTSGALPGTKCVFLHGVNPYGFAWLRRFNENNVDLNRNFLLPGEPFDGAPEVYAKLDRFLNPQRPPASWEPVKLKAACFIARYGIPALRQAIAGGQYRFPRGLFFGGFEPSQAQKLLAENMPRWLLGSKRVVHLDFHTGLGKQAACKLLIDYPLPDRFRDWLSDWYGSNAFETNDASDIAYQARGEFGRWCVSQDFAPDYLYACAEFGTYDSVKVLLGLRAENQAHHWGTAGTPSTTKAKSSLKELFCPASASWRSKVIERGRALVVRAERGLIELGPPAAQGARIRG
jgi:hypothetical protein